MSPVQTAVWWTEYVLRHKDTTSLKSVTRHQTWFERRMLDVWLVVFLALQLAIGILALIVYKIYKFLTDDSSSTIEASRQKARKKQ
jgi:uncharacterized protein (DUF2062 family)